MDKSYVARFMAMHGVDVNLPQNQIDCFSFTKPHPRFLRSETRH